IAQPNIPFPNRFRSIDVQLELTVPYVAELCAERDLAGRHNTGGLGSGRAGCYPTLFRVLNPRAARAGCAVFVMGARPRSVRTRIAHAACPQDPEVVIAHNLLVIVRLLFCLLSLLRILEPPKLPTSARREQSSPVYPDRPQQAKLARLGVASPSQSYPHCVTLAASDSRAQWTVSPILVLCSDGPALFPIMRFRDSVAAM